MFWIWTALLLTAGIAFAHFEQQIAIALGVQPDLFAAIMAGMFALIFLGNLLFGGERSEGVPVWKFWRQTFGFAEVFWPAMLACGCFVFWAVVAFHDYTEAKRIEDHPELAIQGVWDSEDRDEVRDFSLLLYAEKHFHFDYRTPVGEFLNARPAGEYEVVKMGSDTLIHPCSLSVS